MQPEVKQIQKHSEEETKHETYAQSKDFPKNELWTKKIKSFKSMRDNFKRLILSNSYYQQYHNGFEIPGKRLGWVEAIMEIGGQLMNH